MENSTTSSLAKKVLAKIYGYESFRGQQEEIINHVIKGGDTLVLMPTGGGKSLCYQIPAIVREGVGIVISPLIALMQDQVSALKENGVKAAFLNSTLSPAVARGICKSAVAGEIDLLYVSPERLLMDGFMQFLEGVNPCLFAIDEAHCVSMWGHDFRKEYTQLGILHKKFPHVPRIALTATADAPTRKDIIEKLNLQEAKLFLSSFDRPNIRYRIVPKTDGRRQLLNFIRSEHEGDSGIVYAQTRNNVEKISEWLNKQGIKSLPYHAGMDTEQRQEHQDKFLREEGLVIVATIAFGMGIDKSNVRFVAHLGMPKSLEAYYQETGRAGRDGLPSNAWMAFGHADAIMIRKWSESSDASAQQKMIENQKLNALLGLCESVDCRRKVVLNYFGEEHKGHCGNCDNCLNPPKTYDGTIDAQKALSAVYRTDQMFGTVYLVDVLVGSENQRIFNFNHHQIKTYGVGKNEGKHHWFSVYRQLIAGGYLDVDHENGGLYLSSEGGKVLKGELTVEFRRDPVIERPKKVKGMPSSRSSAMSAANFESHQDKVLFDTLRQQRKAIAMEQDVPAYIIFSDATLVDMVVQKPETLNQMLAVRGVGEAKLEKYGEDFLEVILGSL